MTGRKGDTENNALARVMDLLIDISIGLEAAEHGMDELRAACKNVHKACLPLGLQPGPAEGIADTMPSMIPLLGTLHPPCWQIWLNQ